MKNPCIRMFYLKFHSTYNICIIYLHVIEALWKIILLINKFYFCHSKNPSDVIKIFLIPSPCIFEKNFLVNKCKKQRCYTENKPLFFDVMKNDHIFLSKVCHFQHDHRFRFSRAIGNIRACKEVRLKMIRIIWEEFSFSVSAKLLIETSNVSYLLSIQSTLKDMFSSTFSNDN